MQTNVGVCDFFVCCFQPRRSRFRRGPKEIKAVYDAWKKILGTTGAELVFWENFVLGVEIWDEVMKLNFNCLCSRSKFYVV